METSERKTTSYESNDMAKRLCQVLKLLCDADCPTRDELLCEGFVLLQGLSDSGFFEPAPQEPGSWRDEHY